MEQTEQDQARNGQGGLVVALEARIASLEAALHTQQITAETNDRKVMTLINDLNLLADELRSEAISRDWCSEYGRFVDEVNGRTSQEWLRHCTWTYELRYEVHITVEARNASDLVEEIRAALGEAVESVDFEDASLEEINVRLTGNERDRS